MAVNIPTTITIRDFLLIPSDIADFLIIGRGTKKFYYDVPSITYMMLDANKNLAAIATKDGHMFALENPANMTFPELRESLMAQIGHRDSFVIVNLGSAGHLLINVKGVVSMNTDSLAGGDMHIDFDFKGKASVSFQGTEKSCIEVIRAIAITKRSLREGLILRRGV